MKIFIGGLICLVVLALMSCGSLGSVKNNCVKYEKKIEFVHKNM